MKKYKQILFASLLLFAFSTSLNAQSISGIINDSEGLPLPGATVQNLNTQDGVSTDFDGKFSIDASVNDVLKISYIGFETFELKISNLSDDFTIQLELGNALDEVIVTSLGIVRQKRELTYATQSVDTEGIDESRANGNLTRKGSGYFNSNNKWGCCL